MRSKTDSITALDKIKLLEIGSQDRNVELRPLQEEHAEAQKHRTQLARKEYRRRCGHIVDNVAFDFFIFLVVIFDLFLRTSEWNTLIEEPSWSQWGTIGLISVYFIELFMRIRAYTLLLWFTNWIDVLDFIVVMWSVTYWILCFENVLHPDESDQLMRNLFSMFRPLFKLTVLVIYRWPNSCRRMVARNKQGIRFGRKVLDLCYITDQIIAMGLPATGFESCYRNSIKDVAYYLDSVHDEKYLILDLCEERTYSHRYFHYNVLRSTFADHSVPALGQFVSGILHKCHLFLREDPDNVVAIHCKGGKGRTGLVAVALMSITKREKFMELLQHFAQMRTDGTMSGKQQEIKHASQKRYAKYIYKMVRRDKSQHSFLTSKVNYLTDDDTGLQILGFQLGPFPNKITPESGSEFTVHMRIVNDIEPLHEQHTQFTASYKNEDGVYITCGAAKTYKGNLFISIRHHGKDVGGIVIHTFMETPKFNNGGYELMFTHDQLDSVKKDYPRDFKLIIKTKAKEFQKFNLPDRPSTTSIEHGILAQLQEESRIPRGKTL